MLIFRGVSKTGVMLHTDGQNPEPIHGTEMQVVAVWKPSELLKPEFVNQQWGIAKTFTGDHETHEPKYYTSHNCFRSNYTVTDQVRELPTYVLPKTIKFQVEKSQNGCFQKWWYPQIIHFGVPPFLETPK